MDRLVFLTYPTGMEGCNPLAWRNKRNNVRGSIRTQETFRRRLLVITAAMTAATAAIRGAAPKKLPKKKEEKKRKEADDRFKKTLQLRSPSQQQLGSADPWHKYRLSLSLSFCIDWRYSNWCIRVIYKKYIDTLNKSWGIWCNIFRARSDERNHFRSPPLPLVVMRYIHSWGWVIH